jgi:hypothetical protein
MGFKVAGGLNIPSYYLKFIGLNLGRVVMASMGQGS